MKKSTALILMIVLGVALLNSACTTVRYSAHNLDKKVKKHKKIAILPVEVAYAGPLPRGITKEELIAMDIGESRFYHQAFYNSILRKSHKYPKIGIQPMEKTIAILKDEKISLHKSWQMAPEELAELLGVDAVVKMQVEENRYMSDGAAFGLEMGSRILFGPPGSPFFPGDDIRTADLFINCSLFDAKEGDLLWKLGVQRRANWDNPPELIMEMISRKVARNFPYKR